MSKLASVYDPMGFTVPATLPGKLLIQDLWKRKIDWDEKLPTDLQSRWDEIAKGFQTTEVTRFVNYDPSGDNELHCFVDASGKAYSAVCYLRQKVNNEYRINLLFAKSRVAPTSTRVTIPRLELLGMLIGCRMLRFLATELHIPIQHFHVWTDSQCVLHWLKTVKPLTRWVENRLKEIKEIQHSLKGPVSFHYVPSADNPADIGTRGSTFQELNQNQLWFHGPAWLHQPDLPEWNLPSITNETLSEVMTERQKKQGTIEIGMTAAQIDLNNLIDVNKHSSLRKLLKTTLYIFRFLKKSIWHKLSVETRSKHYFLNQILEPVQKSGSILLKEWKIAQLFWDHKTQQNQFGDIIFNLQKNKVLLCHSLSTLLDFVKSF